MTKAKYLDRISKNGLTPKTTQKFNNHPERVYIFKNKPDNWRNIVDFFKSKDIESERNERYVLLTIDKSKLNKGIKFYYDPNSNNETAFYTLEPIPPYAINGLLSNNRYGVIEYE